eukprot:Skav236739  [mRNA]  locus=scaffold3352:294820:301513:+ [translate_table: standard]
MPKLRSVNWARSTKGGGETSGTTGATAGSTTAATPAAGGKDGGKGGWGNGKAWGILADVAAMVAAGVVVVDVAAVTAVDMVVVEVAMGEATVMAVVAVDMAAEAVVVATVVVVAVAMAEDVAVAVVVTVAAAARPGTRSGGSGDWDFHSKGGKGGEPGPGTKLFIGNLPTDITEEALNYVFRSYGTVVKTFIMSGRSKSGQNCAFVEYESTDQAETAIATLHDKYEIKPGAGTILVKRAKSGRVSPY